jgi:hypothetical protein
MSALEQEAWDKGYACGKLDAVDRIEALEARLDRAVTRGLEQVEQIATLEAALREYESDYCEGWCRDAPPQAMFDCGGCRARAALTPEQKK